MQNIFLSLGSNQGNTFEQLQAAVNAIYQSLGDIKKISSVYRSPALGFDGPDFMNCIVWVSSDLSPAQVLKHILEIEKTMGRVRNQTEGYSSRTIDIDIITIDDVVKKTKKLELPHPKAHERLFVLRPLQEVHPEIILPKHDKDIDQLIEQCQDSSVLEKLSKWLRNPKKSYALDRYNYIAIEGNIGAGKTSLATQIAADFNAKLVLERFKDNPFLPKFYEDQSRYAFPLEMSFLADRYQQLMDDIAQYDLFKKFMVADYDVFKSLIFAQVTLLDDEYSLYKKLFHLMHRDLARPDLYVYLYQTTESLLANIKKRGRDYEQSIKVEYLEKLNHGYLTYIRSLPPAQVKVIDVSELDFVANRADYLKVLKAMSSVDSDEVL
ncbi:MAG: 2-amino-4-hydroxy-6-hydroxymethyldihydropteridine diphosphokinase [Gilvibacter sp.]